MSSNFTSQLAVSLHKMDDEESNRLISELRAWGIGYLMGGSSNTIRQQLPPIELVKRLAQCEYPRVRDASISLFLLHPELADAALEEYQTSRPPVAEQIAFAISKCGTSSRRIKHISSCATAGNNSSSISPSTEHFHYVTLHSEQFRRSVFCMEDPLVQPWDDSLKKLVHASPQAFARLVDPNAQFIYEVKEKLKPLTRDVDGLLLVRRKDGKRQLVHIEIQSTNDPAMPDRMLVYNVLARTQYDLPVLSCVIYLRKDGNIPQPHHQWKLADGRVVLEFHYQVIELADIAAEELLAIGEVGLLPLLPLTKDGATREIAEEMFTELQAVGNLDLLQIGQMIASLAFGETRPADQEWVLRRYYEMYDRLQETPLYKEMTRLASEKARAEALKEAEAIIEATRREVEATRKEAEEALEKGELKGLREGVLTLVQGRFPKLLRLTKGLASTIEDASVLQNLILKMGTASTIEEARQYLLDISEDNNSNY